MANYNTLLERFNEHPVTLNTGTQPLADHQPVASAQRPPAPPQAAFNPQSRQENIVNSPTNIYPMEAVISSNNQVINAQFSHETISMSAFQNLCPKSVQLFSDGIYRLVKENNGVVSHIPALVNGN